MLAAGANIGAQSDTHEMALGYAIEAGSMAVVEVLLAAGAPLEEPWTRFCALDKATIHAQPAIFARLLKAGANLRGARGRTDELTPLQFACRSGVLEHVTALVGAGAELDLRNRWGATALDYARDPDDDHGVQRTLNPAIAELLLRAGARDDRALRDELIDATKANDEARVAMALAAGADPNASPAGSGWSALMFAVYRSSPAVVRRLLAQAGPNHRVAITAHESRPLIIGAGAGGQVEIVEELQAAGHDVNSTDSLGCSALSEAARMGHAAMVRHLLATGATFDAAARRFGPTMCEVKDPAVLRLLFAVGADVDIAHPGGLTQDGRTIEGITPLLAAILDDAPETVACLLELGADPRRPARDGTTPMGLARALARPACVALLQTAGIDEPETEASPQKHTWWRRNMWPGWRR